MENSAVKEATVVKHTGSHYLLSELPEWKPFPAVLRGKVRLEGSKATNPIAVGDRVSYIVADESGQDTAVITDILPRKNYLIRKSTNLSRDAHILAANVDRAFVVVTLAFPEVKLPFLDRLLVTCEVYGIPATIVLNKVDLLREACGDDFDATVNWFKDIYGAAGYPVIEASALTGEGIDKLRGALASSGVNLLSGISGVGKSSLIKALDPSLEPPTGEISLAHLQGKHTTTFYEMYPLCSGGFIIDTPGIRSFGLLDLKAEEIALYFPEMLRASKGEAIGNSAIASPGGAAASSGTVASGNATVPGVSAPCRFTPCTHTHEPGCAVKAAVENGSIPAERYSSYLGMLEEYQKYR